MLKILHNICDLVYSQILNVYKETIARTAAKTDRASAEQSFYDDLQLFLSEQNTACYVWVVDGRYTSCVRCEPYADGILLTCLETAPEERRKGYAATLLKDVLTINSQIPIYVHIHNKNRASIALHEQLGFRTVADYARLIDGTVSRSYCTMIFK